MTTKERVLNLIKENSEENYELTRDFLQMLDDDDIKYDVPGTMAFCHHYQTDNKVFMEARIAEKENHDEVVDRIFVKKDYAMVYIYYLEGDTIYCNFVDNQEGRKELSLKDLENIKIDLEKLGFDAFPMEVPGES